MRIWERILTGIAGIIVGSTALLFWWLYRGEAAVILRYIKRVVAPGEMLLLSLALALLALYLLLSALARCQSERGVIMSTGMGQVKIALRAIDNLVHRAAVGVRGVKEVQTQLSIDKKGLVVRMSVFMIPDLNIPEVAEAVQRRVETYLGETVGISISGIHVQVRNIATDLRARVE